MPMLDPNRPCRCGRCGYDIECPTISNENSSSALLRFQAAFIDIKCLVNKQAKDEGLWFIAKTAPEHNLQYELRRLHERVESCMRKLDNYFAKEDLEHAE